MVLTDDNQKALGWIEMRLESEFCRRCVGVPHFHWLIRVRNRAAKFFTAGLRCSNEFTVILQRAQDARMILK